MRIENKHKIFLYTIPLLVLMIAFIIKATSLGYSDFAAYYFGSQQLLAGNYMIAYDTASLNLAIYDLGYKDLFVSYTPFPPFTSVAFAPFTFLPIEISKIIFNIISCSLFLFSLYRSCKYFSINPTVLLLIPVIFYTPIRSNVFFGQSYLLLFCLLIEGFMAYKKGQIILSSSLWGFAIVFKVFPVLIFFYLLVKKEYRSILYLSAVCVLLLLSSIIINGFAPWKLYITEIFPRLNNGELNDSYTFIFQSAFMLLKNIFVYDEVMNPGVIYNNPYLFYILIAVFKGLVIASCIIVTIKKKTNDLISFSIWILASILISPNGSTYSLILLLIPLIALNSIQLKLNQKILSAFLVLLICNIPVHYFASVPLLMKFPRLYLMIMFFVAIIIITKIRFDYKIILGLTCLFLILEIPKLFKPSDKSVCVFTKNEYPIIYDFSIKENKLTFYYWAKNRNNQKTIDYKTTEPSKENISLINNQIYYNGKKITHTPDWKKKPIISNGKYLLYLSDKNRGCGFYTLRKLMF
jgi:hypothetical protein